MIFLSSTIFIFCALRAEIHKYLPIYFAMGQELHKRGGIKSKIFFLISQRKHILSLQDGSNEGSQNMIFLKYG